LTAAGGIDPDRGSFSIALNAARDLLTQAANVIVGAVVDLIGALGRRVLDNLLPDRRLRVRSPHRQTRDLEIPGQRPQHQPAQLQGHPHHQHPDCIRTLTRPARTLITWPWG
jgi:hypothetical protein